MANILSLPAELLHRILSCLPQSTLTAICRTCKTLQPYAEQQLYESIEFSFKSEYNGHADDIDVLTIHCFFHSIWRRPELAAFVKSAHFTTEESSYHDGLVDVPPPTSIRRALFDFGTQAGLPPQGLDRRVENGEANTLTAILLSRLHRLARLEVDYMILQQSPDIEQVIWQSFDSPTTRSARFLELTRLSVGNALDCNIIRINDGQHGLHDINDAMLSLFTLPTLKEADLILVGESGLVPWRYGESSDVSLPLLRRLGILSCGASLATLRQMLAVTPRLETLEFFFVQDSEGLKYDEDYVLEHSNEWQEFAAALRPVRGTLKNLTISADWAFVDDEPPDTMDLEWVMGIWQRLGDVRSLGHLTCLERLEVPIFVLLGWTPSHPGRGLADVLPITLRELCLRDDLVDFEEYNWTPWNSHVIGGEMAESFQETCDPTIVLTKLAEYVAPLTRHEEGERPLALETLCLKMQKNRVWPLEDLMHLEMLSRSAVISCTVRVRMSGFLTSWDEFTDEVTEIIIYEPTSVKSSDMDPSERQSSEESLGRERKTPEQDAQAAEDLARKASRSPSSSESSNQYADMYERYDYRYFEEPRRIFRDNRH